jgi:hypothetical protein
MIAITRRTIPTGLCAAFAVLTILRTGDAAAPASIDLAVPERTNAYPSVAAQGQLVALSWAASAAGATTDIYTAVSRDGGLTFAKPVRVNDAAGRASVSGEQPPRVAIVPSSGRAPAIAVVWSAKGAAGTRLLSARSEDGGASFGPASPLPGSDATGNRGWESIAVDSKGQVVAIWLDHRESASGTASAPIHHAGQAHTGHGDSDGAARAQQSKLYFATIGGEEARPITGGVCYCCKTAVAVGADAAIYAAWRHVYPGNIRDIAFTWSRDGGRTFAPAIPVSQDQWALDGCPENGPAIAVDSRNRVHVVWPTLVNGTGGASAPNLALFHAVRTGDRFSPRQAIPTSGTPRHPALAAGPAGSLLVAWDEQAGGTRRVALATGAAAGNAALTFRRLSIGTAGRSEYPALASTGDAFVAAWTSGPADRSTIHVERIANRP